MRLFIKALPLLCLLALKVGGQTTTQTPSQLFSDERAGYHIDNLSRMGIQLLLKWRQQFLADLTAMNETMNWVENTLNTHYETMPNLTAYAQDLLVDVNAKLDTAQAMADAMNLTNDGDGMVAFMKSPRGTVNVPGHYDPTLRAGGTFIVPRRGLYQVTVRTGTGSNVNVDVQRNGNETLTSLSNLNFYDVRTRIRLVWLNPGDEIFTTGNIPGTLASCFSKCRVSCPLPSELAASPHQQRAPAQLSTDHKHLALHSSVQTIGIKPYTAQDRP